MDQNELRAIAMKKLSKLVTSRDVATSLKAIEIALSTIVDKTSGGKAGEVWSIEEEQRLIQAYTTKQLTLEQIANNHGRTVGAIRSRAERLGLAPIGLT